MSCKGIVQSTPIKKLYSTKSKSLLKCVIDPPCMYSNLSTNPISKMIADSESFDSCKWLDIAWTTHVTH